MANRPANPPFPRSDPHRSGLLRAVFSTGRVRGSSATPEPVISSPTPNRDISKQLIRMENKSQQSTPKKELGESPNPSPASFAASQRATARGSTTSTPTSNRSRSSTDHGSRLSQGSQHGGSSSKHDVSLRREYKGSSRASQFGGSADDDSQHGPFSDSHRLPDSLSSQHGGTSQDGSPSSQSIVQYSPGSFEEVSTRNNAIYE